MNPKTICGIVFLAICITKETTALRCHQCLIVDCDESTNECMRYKTIAYHAMESFYLVPRGVSSCGNFNKIGVNSTQETGEDLCFQENGLKTACALGRFQIKRTYYTKQGTLTSTYAHGTVMGCARPRLLHRINTAFGMHGACDVYYADDASPGSLIKLTLEHCKQPSTFCDSHDYCISSNNNNIRSFNGSERSPPYNPTHVVAGLSAVLLVVTAIIALVIWKGKLGNKRSSGEPRQIGGDIELNDIPIVRSTDPEE